MEALFGNVQHIALFLHELMHQCYSRRFIIIRTDVHALNTQTLIIGKEVNL